MSVGERSMRYSVCGIACEVCPRMVSGKCPAGPDGCIPRENRFCEVCSCAHRKGVRTCFACPEFPCETTKKGPISYGYCEFIAGRS